MDILLAFIFGASVGLVGQFALPGRDLRGVALLPVIAAFASGAVWAGLTWSLWPTTEPGIWVVSVAAAVGTTLVVGVLLTRVRRARDARERIRLRVA